MLISDFVTPKDEYRMSSSSEISPPIPAWLLPSQPKPESASLLFAPSFLLFLSLQAPHISILPSRTPLVFEEGAMSIL
jgi:hypothetical protein